MAKIGRPKLKPEIEYTRLNLRIPKEIKEKLVMLTLLSGASSLNQYISDLCERETKAHEVELDAVEKMRNQAL